MKLVEPDLNVSIIDNKKERNKFFAILKTLGYDDSEIEIFQRKVVELNDQLGSGKNDSQGDTLLLQAKRSDLGRTDKSRMDRKENFSISGDRIGYGLYYDRSNSRTEITDEEGKNTSKLLGTGVRSGISAQEGTQLARGLGNTINK